MPSAVVRHYQYDEKSHVLTIVFVSGTTYEYLDVPPEVFQAFRAFRAKGQFFSQHIRDAYQYRKIG